MDRKIIEYINVTASTLDLLTQQVKMQLREGYEPFGAVTFLGFSQMSPNHGGFGLNALPNVSKVDRPFVQTMVKYEDINKENNDARD